jgi:hypothetical protein
MTNEIEDLGFIKIEYNVFKDYLNNFNQSQIVISENIVNKANELINNYNCFVSNYDARSLWEKKKIIASNKNPTKSRPHIIYLDFSDEAKCKKEFISYLNKLSDVNKEVIYEKISTFISKINDNIKHLLFDVLINFIKTSNNNIYIDVLYLFDDVYIETNITKFYLNYLNEKLWLPKEIIVDYKNIFDEENYESDTNVDFYDTLLDMMGPEEERPKVTSRKKPKDMSDEEIYRKRMTTGASLQDVAEELGLTRMEVRKREQRHMRKMRKEKDGVSLSSGASDDWATSRGYEPDRFDLRETMNQIGRGNIMAISGGRVERRGNEMILPSTKDQQVVIGYNSVPDLYYVRAEQKINTGKDKGTNRILAQWDEVYADEIGELAYQASLKPANLNSENKEYWKLGKGNQFADRLVDRRSGKLINKDSRNLPSKPAAEESPSLSSGSRGRDYYNYDITTTDEGNGLLDQVHDYLEENPLIKDDITTDIADMLGGDGIVEANGFDTKKAFDSVNKNLMKAAWIRLGVPADIADYLTFLEHAPDGRTGKTAVKTPHAN